MKTITKTMWLMGLLALCGALAFANAQTSSPKFTEFKFFSTKGAFDWDKVVYATQFEQSKLHELQVLIEFENPSAKPFQVEVKSYHNGQPLKTEPFNDLKESGGINSGIGGSADTPGTVAPGVYKAELWYNGKVVKIAEATVTGTAHKTNAKRIWHLTVESREDIGETAAEFQADLKKAFEKMGDTVVEEASKESIDLYFYLGKDDADDDNDGKPDDKDVADANSDGAVNEQDMAEVIDLDKEIPDVMDDFPDKDKSAGIYIYLEKETGLAMVFVSKADALKETKVAARPIQRGNSFLPNVAFLRTRAADAGAQVAAQVAKTVDQPGGTRFYMGNLPYVVTEAEIREFFQTGGERKVISVEIVLDKETNTPRGFAFVTLANAEQASSVIRDLHGKALGNRKIVVNETRGSQTSGVRGQTYGGGQTYGYPQGTQGEAPRSRYSGRE